MTPEREKEIRELVGASSTATYVSLYGPKSNVAYLLAALDECRREKEAAEKALQKARPFVEAEFEATDDGGYFAVLEEIDEALAAAGSEAA